MFLGMVGKSYFIYAHDMMNVYTIKERQILQEYSW